MVGLAGLYEAVEPTSIRVLARRLALGHLLRVAEDGQVLCDGVYIYIYINMMQLSAADQCDAYSGDKWYCHAITNTHICRSDCISYNMHSTGTQEIKGVHVLQNLIGLVERETLPVPDAAVHPWLGCNEPLHGSDVIAEELLDHLVRQTG